MQELASVSSHKANPTERVGWKKRVGEKFLRVSNFLAITTVSYVIALIDGLHVFCVCFKRGQCCGEKVNFIYLEPLKEQELSILKTS